MKSGKSKTTDARGGADHRTTHRLSRIASLHGRAFSAVYYGRFKLAVNSWRVLSVIGRFAPLSANTTGAHSSLAPDKVTRAVNALARQGYVLRRQDPFDRRRVVLSLSAKGRRVHNEVSRFRDAIEREFLRALSPTEIASLYRILDKLEAQASRLFSDRQRWREALALFAAANQADAGRPARGRRRLKLPAAVDRPAPARAFLYPDA